MIFMSDSQNSRISHLLSPDSLEGKTHMIVGLGSLGFPAMQHLAMSGVHRWVLVDFDTYEEDNLVKHDSNASGSKEDFNMKVSVDFISNWVLLHNVSEEMFY